MRQLSFWRFAVPAFALLVVFIAAFLPPRPANAAPPLTQIWEYRVYHLDQLEGTSEPVTAGRNTKPFEDGLNKRGAEGWELAVMDTLQNQRIAIFKRAIAAPSR